jgi:hypothetical protein
MTKREVLEKLARECVAYDEAYPKGVIETALAELEELEFKDKEIAFNVGLEQEKRIAELSPEASWTAQHNYKLEVEIGSLKAILVQCGEALKPFEMYSCSGSGYPDVIKDFSGLKEALSALKEAGVIK